MRSLFLLLAFSLGSHAAEVGVLISPPPIWVESSPAPNLGPTPAADMSYGYDYLLLDRQVNVRAEGRYYRTVYRITSESSLQDGGRLTWSFDPAYERLTVHHVRVIRDGVTHDRLQEDLIKTIQQERELDRHLLNGQLTGIAVLEDVRVGDVIDYAFTREGWNPAFGGKYFDSVPAGWSIPVRLARVRVSAPSDRTIRTKSQGDVTLTFTKVQQGDDQVLVWEGSDFRPIAYEGETPSWFLTYPSVQLSEFDAWSDVVEWAAPMYAVPSPMPAVLTEQAERLTRGLSSDAEKAVAILQFVQQEVRYLGMELGAGSYQPSDPAVVLARRFGDCKDKTLLFCTLMRASGLIAYPALLDTDWLDTVDRWLPTPHAFDHVIACIPQGDSAIWVDPTLTYQQGGLSHRALPDYRRALVVRPGEASLTKVTVPETAMSTMRISERFDVVAFDQPARFQVTTISTGLTADSERRYFAQTTPDQIAKRYVNYYDSVYPGVVSTSPPVLTSDAATNTVTVTENYEVPKLWSKADGSETWKAEFYPKPISDLTTRPTTAVRTMPLAISHPRDIHLTTTVNLPEIWNVKPSHEMIASDGFRAELRIAGEGKVVTMTYRWESRADHVRPTAVNKHVEQLSRVRNALGYSLSYTPAKAAAAAGSQPQAYTLNWKLALVAASTMGAMAYAGMWMRRRKYSTPPAIAPVDPSLIGLGGWLVLVGIGVTFRPVWLLTSLTPTLGNTFNQDVWEAITDSSRAAYQAHLGPVVVAETIGNSILVAGSVILIVLYYGKTRAFPGAFIAFFIFTLVFLSLDSWIADLLELEPGNTAESIAGMVQAALQAFVWIPYMLVSKRVKATFVN